MRVELERALLHKKSKSLLVPEDQIEANFRKDDIISITEPRPEDLPKPPEYPKAPERGDDENDEAFAAKMKSWEDGKAKWEEEQAKKPPFRQVNVWVPVYHVISAKIDGYICRVYHTVRGPIVGLVTSEDSQRVTLYSPAFIDPNIQAGRVHFLPIAFAGYQITLHKPCFGECVPEQPICLGYPEFIKQNQAGDFIMRSKGAYHHIDAELDDDANTVSVDAGVRAHLEGALVTTDTRQDKEVKQARQMRQLVERAKQAPDAPPPKEATP